MINKFAAKENLRWKMKSHLKSRVVQYVLITLSILFGVTLFSYFFGINKFLESLREINIFDALMGQIANTLIVLSLTSVLSSNFGQAYWVDIKEMKLIKPFWTCFTGITVYLLTALLYSIGAYLVGLYVGVVLSAVCSTILLIILSFKMISIYFGKEEIKNQLREEYKYLCIIKNYFYISDYLREIKKFEEELRENVDVHKHKKCLALQNEMKQIESKLNSHNTKLVSEAHKEQIDRHIKGCELVKSIDSKIEEHTKNAIQNNEAEVVFENIELLLFAKNYETLFRLMEDLFLWDESYFCEIIRQLNKKGMGALFERELRFFKHFALQRLITMSGKWHVIQFFLLFYDKTNYGMKKIKEDLDKIREKCMNLRDREIKNDTKGMSDYGTKEDYRITKLERQKLKEEDEALRDEILYLLKQCKTKDLRHYYLPIKECHIAYEEGKYEIVDKYIRVILECVRDDVISITFDSNIREVHAEAEFSFSYLTEEELELLQLILEKDKGKSIISEEDKISLMKMKDIRIGNKHYMEI